VAVKFRRFGADMAGIVTRLCLVSWVMLGILFPYGESAAGTTTSSGGPPLDITAERIEYLQELEIYEADGSVVVNQGSLRLTADHMTIQSLPGILIATGHVRLTDPKADLVTERLELNVNTEAGVVTHGRVHLKATNTWVEGRLLQRFSEDHYRVKEGRFSNCDAQEGETPAWRFKFKDLDLHTGDNVAFTGGWFCVNDVPVIPIPTLTYPLTKRRTGFLVPTIGYDNRFGTHFKQSFFWAINPSQDLMISPSYYSNLGYGSDFKYRYILNRMSRGQWFVSALQQTEAPNVFGVNQTGQDAQTRALITGTHTQQFTPDLLLRVQANLLTDPNYLQQLSNSGVQRALPSTESNLLLIQRLPYGNTYLLGQYLQPLQSGGTDTFQRLPEVGYSMPNVSLFNSPILMGSNINFVNFYREQGFTQNRIDVLPGLSTDVLNFGHIVGVTPQVKVREVYYTRGVQTSESQHRETFWFGIDATSKLSRRFRTSQGDTLLHTVEPSVMYEYVPQTNQSQLTQIDQVDDLPKKNLLTYAIRSRLLEQGGGGSSFNWMDFTMAQSYHVGDVQSRARDFTPGVAPPLGSITQPLQPATVAIEGRKLSDLWMKVVIGNTTPQFTPTQLADAALGQIPGVVYGQQPAINQYVTVDAFFDPYRSSITQFNTNFRVQQSNYWYLEVGQRFTDAGNRVRRGDVWNPISFNEVYAPTPEIQFVTAGGAFRTPWGWTVGAKGYYDVKNQRSPEYDVVGLYQNPCKCWSIGFYYLQFPDRQQYHFMLSLTGLGWTESFGTAVVRTILSPLLIGEKGLPWAVPGGPYGRPQSDMPQPEMGGR
jgi:LPS-assembly protein